MFNNVKLKDDCEELEILDRFQEFNNITNIAGINLSEMGLQIYLIGLALFFLDTNFEGT